MTFPNAHSHGEQAASFAELQEKEDLTAQEVVDSLKDYGITGAAIAPDVVIELIDRTKPSEDQLILLLGAASMGISAQRHNATHASPTTVEKEQDAYQAVQDHVRSLLIPPKNEE